MRAWQADEPHQPKCRTSGPSDDLARLLMISSAQSPALEPRPAVQDQMTQAWVIHANTHHN